MKLIEKLKKLNLEEIRNMIVATEGEERRFYAYLYNKVLQLRQKDVLDAEEKYRHFHYLNKEN